MAQSYKSKMEATISEAYIKFLREILGRGPKETKTYIIKDMVIIRLKEVLTQEEKALVQIDRGKPLVKEMRRILRESNSEKTEAIISGITGCQVISSHSDISTKLGEQVELFILDCDLEKELKAKAVL
ncbi:DUF2294 domain-containing protein [Aneurinibacillus danicus]|jgi:uncharacterized protein YbcI|uniref:Na+-translocating membrane potential-generating system MpsC domain-containing protein n=1 Tax=Aneurinibacillus danicus TaxID=267746 RepID=A0A511VFB2_9BACL|nr:DUF2294 domain-containing protein [Aneurinibacillus danicus]GEN36648.1 hypothetical protein ADA01nite_41080 [Aneurinibacillus danicus]